MAQSCITTFDFSQHQWISANSFMVNTSQEVGFCFSMYHHHSMYHRPQSHYTKCAHSRYAKYFFLIISSIHGLVCQFSSHLLLNILLQLKKNVLGNLDSKTNNYHVNQLLCMFLSVHAGHLHQYMLSGALLFYFKNIYIYCF